jgi:hypothetical protein
MHNNAHCSAAPPSNKSRNTAPVLPLHSHFFFEVARPKNQSSDSNYSRSSGTCLASRVFQKEPQAGARGKGKLERWGRAPGRIVAISISSLGKHGVSLLVEEPSIGTEVRKHHSILQGEMLKLMISASATDLAAFQVHGEVQIPMF